MINVAVRQPAIPSFERDDTELHFEVSRPPYFKSTT